MNTIAHHPRALDHCKGRSHTFHGPTDGLAEYAPTVIGEGLWSLGKEG